MLSPAIRKDNDDLDRLQGVWRLTAAEADGEPLSESTFVGAQWIVDGDAIVARMPNGSYRGRFAMDIGRSPKTLNLTFLDGPQQGLSALAIYALDSDRWTLCLGFAGSRRPTAFSTQVGSRSVLKLLERAG